MTPTPTETKSCLDAETLAAWVDGGLDTRAAAMAEAHVSSCPRCQEIAGLVIKTTPTTVESRSWIRIGWLVPLTAGIAAIGLWMIVPASAPVSSPPGATARQATAQEAKAKPADELKPAAPAEEARAKEQGARFRDQAKNEAPKLLAKQDKDQDAKRFDERSADANKLRVQAAPPAAAVADAVGAAPPSAAAPSAPTPRAAAAEAGRLEAQAPARQTFAQVAPAREAVSPDGSTRWRLTQTNALERSTDNGRTWVPVETGAGGPLASIQAVDANTAIVTTVDGRQFRTTDSGKTWGKWPLQDL